MNDYRLEAELEDVNLVIQNLEKPGPIGIMGTTLGKHNVNIANMHLSRNPIRNKAMSIIRIDGEAPPKALDTLGGHPNILTEAQETYGTRTVV